MSRRGVSRKRTHTSPSHHQYARIWNSRAFVLFLIVVLLMILSSVVREIVQRVETQREITRLEEEVAQLSQRNTEVTNAIALLQTSTFYEKEARLKLGVQKPGEQLVLLPDNANRGEIVLPSQHDASGGNASATEGISHPRRWFNFFKDQYTNTH